jgi:hypothetical protein
MKKMFFSWEWWDLFLYCVCVCVLQIKQKKHQIILVTCFVLFFSFFLLECLWLIWNNVLVDSYLKTNCTLAVSLCLLHSWLYFFVLLLSSSAAFFSNKEKWKRYVIVISSKSNPSCLIFNYRSRTRKLRSYEFEICCTLRDIF